MPTFVIDNNDRIKRIAPGNASHRGRLFATKEQLTKLSTQWPGKRLVQIWNKIRYVKPVRKFTDRKTGVNRLWNALQHADSVDEVSGHRPEQANHPKRHSKTARDRRATTRARNVHGGSKKAEILKLLSRSAGATLEHLMTVTGWQAHSVRGFISGGLGKKMGLHVDSSRREDGQRVYQLK